MPEPTIAPASNSPDRAPCEERRASVRHRSARQTDLRSASPPGDSAWTARIRDVSTLGIGLVLPHDLEVGALLEINLAEATGGAAHDVLARVVHTEPDGPGVWQVGCAFVSELGDFQLGELRARQVRTAPGDPRRWMRFPCNVETACSTCLLTAGEKTPARILNVSPGGVGLLLPCEYEVGTLLNLDVTNGAGVPTKLRVRVVRLLPHDSGGWFLGCEFTDQLGEQELLACL